MEWDGVEAAYVVNALIGRAGGHRMLRQLGARWALISHVENASASGSGAFRHACIEVASGISDVALAVGVDKPPKSGIFRSPTGIPNLAEDAIAPFTHFALLTDEYSRKHRIAPEDIALVAVKNHANGATNPNAQRQKERKIGRAHV